MLYACMLLCMPYNIVMEKDFIAKRFASIRLAKNISARQLSLDLEQGSQYINQIENGRKLPSLDGLLKFCNHCSLSLKEFFDDEQEYPIQYKELLKYLNKLDNEELNEVISITKRIAINKK